MARYNWDSNKVAAAIQAVLPGAAVRVRGHSGGDYDTRPVLVGIGNESFFTSGFDTQNPVNNSDTAAVEFVELTDGQDSRGGLNSSTPEMIRAYAEIRIVLEQLLADTDTFITDTYEDYF